MCSTMLFFRVGAYSFNSNLLANIANGIEKHNVKFRKLELLKIARKEEKITFWET